MVEQATARSRWMRTLPPVTALIYPGLIWCGPAVGPIFLAIALIVPGLGLFVAHRTGSPLTYPRSRRIAFAVVGVPPLFTWLGGLFDTQHLVPLGGLHLWFLLWGLLAWAAFAERPREAPAMVEHHERLAFAHGISAIAIVLFALAHLTNHLGGLWGGDRHIAIMTALRHIYRNPLVEMILLGSIAFQMLSGLRLLKGATARDGGWVDTLQAASGAYLAIFFLSHLSAVLRARFIGHVDTNWVWLTSSHFLTDPWSARLVPYYFLAVIALGVHGAAGVRHVMAGHRRPQRLVNSAFYCIVGASTVVSALIMVALLRA